MRYAACLEYDGTAFFGWQKQQSGVRTVQETVERSLSLVANQEVTVTAAGRTDTGVHATHQIIHFDCCTQRSYHRWCGGVNRYLPKDVRMHWIQSVDKGFHARYSALSRSYRYLIYNHSINSAITRHYAAFQFYPLDLQNMSQAVQYLLGEHDFSAFRAAGCQSHSVVRTVYEISCHRRGNWVWYDITANAFLQHMVRNISGALMAIGYGRYPPSWLADLLASKDRTQGAVTAPANGLYLMAVRFPSRYPLPSSEKAVTIWG